jgi:hypothetical protein
MSFFEVSNIKGLKLQCTQGATKKLARICIRIITEKVPLLDYCFHGPKECLIHFQSGIFVAYSFTEEHHFKLKDNFVCNLLHTGICFIILNSVISS